MNNAKLTSLAFVVLFCGIVFGDIQWFTQGSIDTYMPIEQGTLNNTPVHLQTNWIDETGIAGYTYKGVWSQLPQSEDILSTASIVMSSDAKIISGIGVTENTTYLTFNTGILWRLDSSVDNPPVYTFEKLNLLDGYDNSDVWNMSENGNYIVGSCSKGYNLVDDQPVYWTSDNSVYSLGILEHNSILYERGLALAVSNNKNIIGEVGNNTGTLAFIWDELYGMQYLGDVLEQDYGYDIGNDILTTASYISPDGKTILGTGLKETLDGYIAMDYEITIPEPTTILLLGLGGLILRRSIRKLGN